MPGQGRCNDLGWFLLAREEVHIGHQGSSQPPCPGREGVTILAGRGAQWPARIVTATMPGQGGRDDLGGKGRTVASKDRHSHHARAGRAWRSRLAPFFAGRGAHDFSFVYEHIYGYTHIYIYNRGSTPILARLPNDIFRRVAEEGIFPTYPPISAQSARHDHNFSLSFSPSGALGGALWGGGPRTPKQL